MLDNGSVFFERAEMEDTPIGSEEKDPDSVKAEMQRKMAEPGSGEEED